MSKSEDNKPLNQHVPVELYPEIDPKKEFENNRLKQYLQDFNNHEKIHRPKAEIIKGLINNFGVNDNFKIMVLQEFAKQDLSAFKDAELIELTSLTEELTKSKDLTPQFKDDLAVLSDGAKFYLRYQQSLEAHKNDANKDNLALAEYLDDVMQNAKHPEHFRQAAQICAKLDKEGKFPQYETERYAGIAFQSGNLSLQEKPGGYIAFQLPNKNDKEEILHYLNNVEKYARSQDDYAIAAEFCGKLVMEGKFPVSPPKLEVSKKSSNTKKSPEDEALEKYVKFASASNDSSQKTAAVEYFLTQHPVVPKTSDPDEKCQKIVAESMKQLSILTSLMSYKGFSTSGKSSSDLSEADIKILTNTLGNQAGVRQFAQSMNNPLLTNALGNQAGVRQFAQSMNNPLEELSDVQRHAIMTAECNSHKKNAGSIPYKIIFTLLTESMTDEKKKEYYKKSFKEILDSVQYYEEQKYKQANQLDENAELPKAEQVRIDKFVKNIKGNLTKIFERDMDGNVAKNNDTIDDQLEYIVGVISHLEPPSDSNRPKLFMAEFHAKIVETKTDRKSKTTEEVSHKDTRELKALSPTALEKYYAQSFKEVLYLVEKRYLQEHGNASGRNQLTIEDQIDLQTEKDRAKAELTRLFGRDMAGNKVVEPSKDKIPSSHFLVSIVKDLQSLTQVEEHDIKEELGRERRATMAAPPVSRKRSLSAAASSTVSEIGRRLSHYASKRDSQSQSQQSQNQSPREELSPSSDQGQPKRRFTFLSPNSAGRESSASQKPEKDSVSMTLATSPLSQSAQDSERRDSQSQQEETKRQKQQSDQGQGTPSMIQRLKRRRASAMPTVATVREESERSVSRSRSNSFSYSNPHPGGADARRSSDSISPEILAPSPASTDSNSSKGASSPSKARAAPRTSRFFGSIQPNRVGRTSVTTVGRNRGKKPEGPSV